jgi:uncharacterized membrane protein YtjA (UPF0391 family)
VAAAGSRTLTGLQRRLLDMLRAALVFLVIALIAGVLGLFRVEAVSSTVAWYLFVIFLILFVVSLIFGGLRRPPV